MSWFKEFTGKAGALLDRMDQAAATSLQDAGIATPTKGGSRERLETSGGPRTLGGVAAVPYEPTTFQSLSSSSERGAAVAQVLVGSASRSAQLTSTPHNRPRSAATHSSGSGKSERKDLNTDNSIFEFLNAPSVGSGAKKSKVPYTPTSSRPSSGSSNGENRSNLLSPSVSSQSLQQSGLTDEERPQTVAVDISIPNVEDEKKGLEVSEGGATEEVDGESESSAVPIEAGPSSQDEQPAVVGVVARETSPEGAELEAWKQNVSNLELENRLLKREVGALNEELSGVMLRLNKAADVRANSDSEIQTLREQVSRADHMIRQLRSQEEDLQASLAARDSQIEVLRNQLAAGDRALVDANEKLVMSKKEQDR